MCVYINATLTHLAMPNVDVDDDDSDGGGDRGDSGAGGERQRITGENEDKLE